MQQILIKRVPNEEIKERKGFGGADWWYDEDGNLQIRVCSELDYWQSLALIMHELSEAIICERMGVTVEDIDAFDGQNIEAERNPAFNSGDQPDAPYRIPHTYATAVERMFAGIFNIDWTDYDSKLSSM